MTKGAFKKGGTPWNKGLTKATDKRLQNTSKSLKGEKNPAWKGDDAKYVAIHDWVRRWKGEPTTCENCGVSGLTGSKIQWANIDHKYRRVLEDYIRLCVSCHREYDAKLNN